MSRLVNKNIVVAATGRRSSLKMAPEFWEHMDEIVRREGMHRDEIVRMAELQAPPDSTRTDALHIYILKYFAAAATEEGHRAAGHGEDKLVKHEL